MCVLWKKKVSSRKGTGKQGEDLPARQPFRCSPPCLSSLHCRVARRPRLPEQRCDCFAAPASPAQSAAKDARRSALCLAPDPTDCDRLLLSSSFHALRQRAAPLSLGCPVARRDTHAHTHTHARARTHTHAHTRTHTHTLSRHSGCLPAMTRWRSRSRRACSSDLRSSGCVPSCSCASSASRSRRRSSSILGVCACVCV